MNYRKAGSAVALLLIRFSHILLYGIAFLIAGIIIVKAAPIFSSISPGELLFTSVWYPQQGKFGFLPFIAGSLAVTILAVILSLPVCLMSSVYITEYMGRRMRKWFRMLIDILAGIPSVIFGLFGVLTIVPAVRLAGHAVGHPTTGYSLLAAGIILALMISPFIISLSVEVLLNVPREVRESAICLGATKWEVIRHVLLKTSWPGILAAVVLGLARAVGETMAVMMVAGNVVRLPGHLLDPVYPLPALIANNYGEMMSIPKYDSALLFAALILMLLVGTFSITAHLVLSRMQRRYSA